MKTIDRVMSKFALPLLAIAAMLLILIIVLDSSGTTTENNAYVRVINCIVSSPATSRTQVNIEQCYKTVENELNVKLQRYDNAAK